MGVVVKWLEIQLSRTIHWFGCPTSPSAMQTSNLPRKELTWRSYTVAEALPTTKRVEIIDKKEFAKAALDENVEAFVVHVTSLSLNSMPIHPAREAQIASLVIEEVQIPELDEHVEAFVVHVTSLSTMPIYPAREAQIASLVAEEVKIPTEYSDFSDVFLEEKASILPEVTELNQHAIELQEGQQPPYGPIYSRGPVELETLKTYIKTNLANVFIRPSKSPTGAPILFVGKPNGSLRLWVDYRGLNNLTSKNRYPLPLIGKSLNRWGQAKRFTQLDLTSVYHRMRIKEGNKWKPAFRTRYRHFEYQVMLFRLSNAPASFQGYINKIPAEKLDIFVIVYPDDILIYTKDPGQGHVKVVSVDFIRIKFVFWATYRSRQLGWKMNKSKR